MKSRSYLFLDESGHAGTGAPDDYHGQYLALVGCALRHQDYVSGLKPAFGALRQKYFAAVSPPPCFHRSDIMRRKGPFVVLRDAGLRQAFDNDLLKLYRDGAYTVIAVVIDKQAHGGRHEFYGDAYHFALALMLERFAGLLRVYDGVGHVVAEPRGKGSDQPLADAYTAVYDHGTTYHEPSFFQERLASRQLLFRQKQPPVPGLELADLLARTAKCDVLADNGRATRPTGTFTEAVAAVLERKYNRTRWTRQVRGYGKVFFTWPPAQPSKRRPPRPGAALGGKH